MNIFSLRVLGKRIKAIWFMMHDKSVKRYKKIIIMAGIIYLFLPVDIIPPIFLPFGFIDDLIIWGVILWYLKDELDRYWMGEKSVDLSKQFKDTVESEGHTVEEDKGGNSGGE